MVCLSTAPRTLRSCSDPSRVSHEHPSAGLEMLANIDAIDRRKAKEAVALMDRVCAMTYKLIGG